GARLRALGARPDTPPVPTICVGNLTAGGAGKTPMVAYLAARLSGWTPHVLLRGHGGRLGRTVPHRVDLAADDATAVGDEALLHAPTAPTWVARDRAAGLRAAAAAGAGVVLMDDGYQNPHVAPQHRLLMVDAGQGFGNGRLIPAGPLRERVTPGIARADAIVLVGDATARSHALRRWPALGVVAAEGRLAAARLEPIATGLPLDLTPVMAFAGIGRPEKFFETLRTLGADLRLAEAFPDHHVYPDAVLERMIRQARTAGAMLVTTEKDAVRLPARFRGEVMALPVRLVFDEAAALDRALGAFGPS
ncbi:MAG: tetraacyldisaccharide 4'-kinase, partial [Pseudomonadota bacterium]